MEDFLYGKLDHTAPQRPSASQLLGRHMENAAGSLGLETPYGECRHAKPQTSTRELSIEDKMTAAAELDSTFGTPECRVQLRCCTTSPGCLNELH
ncbi:Endophilin-B2 [Merluccius polli]|uniref:Endophilin-B2 n=1 Tax=Merluccius polli TaxID=89951 RepID=A0AA47LZ32_MERPO|nr:Endophilin-B2 [Merluccius polli]